MAERVAGVRLAPYTTLGLGGPARAFVEARSAEELVGLVAEADRAGEPVLVLGGGSNLVVADEGFDGLVVRVASRGIEVAGNGDSGAAETGRNGGSGSEDSGAGGDGRNGGNGDSGAGDAGWNGGDRITAQAGEDWDALVERAVAEGRPGIECLSGIPGLVGSTPIQNVGAYGQDVSQTITAVRVYDRVAGEVRDLTAAECGFAYRHSAFKQEPGRHLVLAVTYALPRDAGNGGLSAPIAYKELAARLGVGLGERAPLAEVRQAVLTLRAGKGMVLDPADPDTRSAGSFFTNPVLTADEAAELELRAPGFPRWDVPGGAVKVPAAWLIENAGFPKGYRRGPAAISTKHTLALTNPELAATTEDLLALAREVRDGVREKFGVTLVNEPVMAGTRL
ncbi:UDP-N-acetylenolpyruvoylglucosamine reductase [Planomonospora parontospora subsp. parontospora]|uniref:UDP-N-acetylenolpyruvoylglucosamine reductase n=2 Tax=Planomonospora parontospora TaxID=58119 RepID=A0AA37BDB4_9ACTN|nr:UDP-N-acetylmuramate dehydrogenase [Planomonospora parontospora]GGK53335.1 UDP-N-acetylenolpyruvoylglucosamine reductase [Planomonospora parontospora]GII07651.1 UDP-N-acetylenolpyruvoylglucosamine reductase [Planomonospora parontospora subsp. parontospora]